MYLIQGIRSITDQFLNENCFVGIEDIDDERYELDHFCLEGKSPHLLLSMGYFLRQLGGEEMQYCTRERDGQDCVLLTHYKKSTRG